MSSFPAGSNTEDRRHEIVAMAARTERGNQPRHLLLISLALVVAALVYLMIGWRAQAGAEQSLREEKRNAETVQNALGTLRALQAAGTSAGPKANESSASILSQFQRAGSDAGLKNPVTLPKSGSGRASQTSSNKDVAKVTWVYTLKDPSLSALWEFMKRATESVSGLEVYSVSLKPVGTDWELTVEFCRWERVEGT
ncbi:MAG: hypothetical protein WC718_09690 [Phycisphaerales bacterium]|jgi:type II secretory pathway pseudopilin PulG